MAHIRCPKCGYDIENPGNFCPKCGENTQTQKPLTSKGGNGNDIPVAILVIIGLIAAMFALMFIVSNNGTVIITNITITEKYPAHSYESWCGKTQCQLVDPPSVVDENGNNYGVTSMQLWGMLRLNQTYQVRYYEYNGGTFTHMIDGAVVNNVTYTSR
jgi:hypothetical protein